MTATFSAHVRAPPKHGLYSFSETSDAVNHTFLSYGFCLQCSANHGSLRVHCCLTKHGWTVQRG